MTDTKHISDAIKGLPHGPCQHVPMIVTQDSTGRWWECAKCKEPLGNSWQAPNFSKDLSGAIDAGCVVLFNKVVGNITTADLKALVADYESLKEQAEWIFGSDRIQLQFDRGEFRYSYHGNKGDSMEGLWCAFNTRNGKYVGDPQRFYPLAELIALATHGGNDD